MNALRFEKPVTVLVGLGMPATIETVMQAYQLLSDWRSTSSQSAHAVALRACKAALEGDVDAETARAALVAFARRNAMLVPEESALPKVPKGTTSAAAALRLV